MKKRDFIKLSLSGMAAGMMPANAFAAGKQQNSSGGAPILRTMGKTGLMVPVVSSGIVPSANEALVRKLFESGIRHFDSAWDYQNGQNDLMIGKMLRKYGRENFIISTKILLPWDPKTGQYQKEATTKAFMQQLDVTMGRLGVDNVDILYLHKPSTRQSALNENMLKGLRKAKEQGKATFVGLSAHSNQVEMIDAAVESRFYDSVLVGYNFFQDNRIKPSIAKASAAGLSVVAMKVFAGGFLDKEQTKPVNKTAALKWVLRDENVHTAILTIKTYEDFEALLPVMNNIGMDEKEINDIQMASAETGLYCLGCEECLGQCPEGLPVPDLMRSYMYAYGYGEHRKAQRVVVKSGISDHACENCGECRITCTKGFEVKEKIADVCRLKTIPENFLV